MTIHTVVGMLGCVMREFNGDGILDIIRHYPATMNDIRIYTQSLSIGVSDSDVPQTLSCLPHLLQLNVQLGIVVGGKNIVPHISVCQACILCYHKFKT